MPFKKGDPKPAGSGRKAKQQNHLTTDLKAMILGALHRGGGENWLLEQMGANPAAFMTLVGKILPLQVTGKDGGPIEHRIDAPAKETREEWLARHAKGEQPSLH